MVYAKQKHGSKDKCFSLVLKNEKRKKGT